VKQLALFGLCFLACAACGKSGGAQPNLVGAYTTHGWNLVSAYERAHAEKNIEHALTLVNLGSGDSTTRDVLIKNLGEDFQKELLSAKLVPLEGHEPLEIVVNDRRMVPNLKVEQRLQLEFRSRGADGKSETSTTEYFVGRLNGRDMIASAQAAN